MPTANSLSAEQAREIRLSGWAGIVAMPLMFVTMIVVGADGMAHFPKLYPYWGDTGAQIAAWFAEHRVAVGLEVAAAAAGLVLLIWLISGLTTYLETCGGRTVVTRMLTPAAVATSVSMQASNPVWLLNALAGTPGHPTVEAFAKYTYELSWMLYLSGQMYGALLLLATAFAFRRTRIFPGWAVWSTVGVGILCALGVFVMLDGKGSLAPGTLASVLPWALFSFWVIAVGIALLRLRPDLYIDNR
ncbi:hypothetical protein [Streptomyces sp. NRRL F-2664]|uniref:hypothetical protein n=1 Tax=Streptomyces sp. NRRL F-2664 TaxID=1463842 RepID=UPI00131D7DCD|nr:hypothetical protein [Streptomyces sp. NRRL F-2664]